MLKFLQSKKGFTIVELLIVVALLGLGVYAFSNLFISTYRSFEKNEERYVKQETVKNIAEILQRRTRVSSSNNACIIADVSSVPEQDLDYSYLYAKYEEPDPDDKDLNGYYLYYQNKGDYKSKAGKDEGAQCLNEGVPLYIYFTPVISGDENIISSGVVVHIVAVEDYVFENGAVIPDEDDYYYNLEVAYHFPNMVANNTPVATPLSGADEKTKREISSRDWYVLRLSIDAILAGDESTATASANSFCFIATASYGADTPEVGMLCEFRDKVLLTNPIGEAFVDAYYKLSPPIADIIRENEVLKSGVRVALKPLIIIAQNALDEEIRTENIINMSIFFVCMLGASITLVKFDKKVRKEEKSSAKE